MLGILKKLVGKFEDSDVVKMFGKVKTEREALILLKEARVRDESRRRESNDRLSSLSNEEQVLMNEGRQDDTSSSKRSILARRVKEIREELRLIQHKIDKIYSPRIKTLNQHIQSLETVIEVNSEPLPSLSSMEAMAVKAKTMVGDLDIAVEMADGIKSPTLSDRSVDSEEMGILEEMNVLREKDEAKKVKVKAKEKSGKAVKPEVDLDLELFDDVDEEDLQEEA
ncbi:MAG: hypothetical protein HC814_03795 [Rhodobacteraceae bacterium]|nr:hypothetical protein [Paracoccaceae bacterium]